MKVIKTAQVTELAAKAAEKALQQRASAQGTDSNSFYPPVIIGRASKQETAR